jgi:hypothetical protein
MYSKIGLISFKSSNIITARVEDRNLIISKFFPVKIGYTLNEA